MILLAKMIISTIRKSSCSIRQIHCLWLNRAAVVEHLRKSVPVKGKKAAGLQCYGQMRQDKSRILLVHTEKAALLHTCTRRGRALLLRQ